MLIWRIGQFPEVEHLDARGRAEVLARVRWWVYPLMFLVSAGAAVIAFFVFGMTCMMASMALLTEWSPLALVAVVMGALTAFCAAWLGQIGTIRRTMRDEIQRLAREGSSPLCLACGYDLRGSPGPNCPECGEPIFGRSGQ